MSAWLRAAGRGRLSDGGLVVWSVAEGARGRRWRWAIDDIGLIRHAGLLELDTEGGFLRLELTAASGLLTLHPEADGSIHGNVVNDDGVRPIEVPGAGSRWIRVEGDAFGSALLGRRAAGEGIVVGSRFRVTTGMTAAVGRLPDLDVRGVPLLDEATEWPLEPDEQG